MKITILIIVSKLSSWCLSILSSILLWEYIYGYYVLLLTSFAFISFSQLFLLLSLIWEMINQGCIKISKRYSMLHFHWPFLHWLSLDLLLQIQLITFWLIGRKRNSWVNLRWVKIKSKYQFGEKFYWSMSCMNYQFIE